jgi:hypothetical protein
VLMLVHEDSVLEHDCPHEFERSEEIFSSSLLLGLWQSGISLHKIADSKLALALAIVECA